MTPELWEQRKKVLTATNMGVLLGESPWGSEEEVWLEKQGLVPMTTPNIAMAGGIVMEKLVRQAFNDQQVWPEYEIGIGEEFFVHDTLPLGATPDGIFRDSYDLLWGEEIKTTSMDWACLPEHVITQCVAGMMCTKIPRWRVLVYGLHKGEAMENVIKAAIGEPVIIDPKRIKVWEIRLEDEQERVQRIAEKCKSWWDTYMVGGVRPDPPPAKPKKKTKKQLKAEEAEDMAEIPD